MDGARVSDPTGSDLSGTESRIANRTIPRIAGLILKWAKIQQREAKKKEPNRSKVELWRIDSESSSESHPINA